MDESARLYSESVRVTPGGVSSPVRRFEPNPLFIEKGEGCRVTDADGKEYIDLCMAYGPLISGHANPEVMAAVAAQMSSGTVYGAPSEPELALLERIVSAIPSADMVRLSCSGTEATMHAIRVARAFTGKNGIVKMNGGFHGAHDAVLVKAGSGSAEGTPSSAGVPKGATMYTRTAEYNDIESLSDILDSSDDIACVIMEPVLGNVGVVPPEKGYLEEVRRITEEKGVVLIFDEVITGFRVSGGGAQKRYGVTPDMTTMGKIIGGGFPAGAFAGKREIMEMVAPQGPAYVAGTFAGNPISAAAGLAQIDLLARGDAYRDLERSSDRLVSHIRDAMADSHVKGCVNSVGSMFSVYFGPEEVRNGTDAQLADREMFGRMFRYMLEHGIYLAPSALEDCFMSTAHDEEAVEALEEAFSGFIGTVAR